MNRSGGGGGGGGRKKKGSRKGAKMWVDLTKKSNHVLK